MKSGKRCILCKLLPLLNEFMPDSSFPHPSPPPESALKCKIVDVTVIPKGSYFPLLFLRARTCKSEDAEDSVMKLVLC